MLARVLSARRALAGEKIVDLGRWRDPTGRKAKKNST
jgi:hypothetical protein